MFRVTHDDRHDMAAVVDQRQAQTLQARLENLRLGLVLFTQRVVALQCATLAAAPAATAGGSDVVKMKPGA